MPVLNISLCKSAMFVTRYLVGQHVEMGKLKRALRWATLQLPTGNAHTNFKSKLKYHVCANISRSKSVEMGKRGH